METGEKINIAIADDHALFRSTLTNILNMNYRFCVTVEAENGKVLLDKLTESETLPDICLLDIGMPVMNGYETIIQLQKHWPDIKVLVVTMFTKEFSIIDMIKKGANGYVFKGKSNIEELYNAIDTVHNKGIYFPNFSPENIVALLQKKEKKHVELSNRETEFLKWCCSDITYEEIAHEMHVSPRTVENYRDALLHKFSVKNRAGLIVSAFQTGIVQAAV